MYLFQFFVQKGERKKKKKVISKSSKKKKLRQKKGMPNEQKKAKGRRNI